METLTLADAKSKRAHIKAAHTRLRTFLDSFELAGGSRHELTGRKQRLLESWSQFEAVQFRIESLESADPSNVDKEAIHELQTQQRGSFEDSYYQLESRITALIEQLDLNASRSNNNGESNQNNQTARSRETRVKLPKIDLPVFAGAYEDWYSYKDTFEKLIHLNEGLTAIEKFYYLRSSLKDGAADVIKSIETTTDNYNEAWAAIKQRFDHERWLIQRHVKALFEISAIRKESHVMIRELVDTILKHLRALKALKRPTDTWDDLVIHLIVSKLDVATSKAWELSIKEGDIPDLKELISFLTRRCQALESVHCRTNNNLASSVIQKHSSNTKTTAVANVATSNLSCSICKETHSIYHCKDFLNMSIEDRIKTVKKAHLCINCLRAAHQAKACNAGTCRKCHKKHNTLLHIPASNDAEQSVANAQAPKQASESPLPVTTQCTSSHESLNVLLSTAIVNIYDSSKQMHSCRALLDSGSQMNFITQELVTRLGLEERSLDIAVAGVMDGIIRANKMVSVCIKSRFNNFSIKMDCVVLPKITQCLPQHWISTQGVSIPRTIKLADPNFNVPANIDILIGAESFWKLLCVGQIKQARNQPTLQKTHFGWIISGTIAGGMAGSAPSCSFHLTAFDELKHALNQFWEIEDRGTTNPFSHEEKECEDLFLQNTRRNDEGRFIVRLPTRQDKLSNLGESQEIALKRFRSLEKRLVTQPQLYSGYKDFMQEYIKLGHMKEVNTSSPLDLRTPTCYLPHHAVQNLASTTTRLRVVFDASCKTSSGISLNDTLMVGPTLQEDLFSILVRFRTFKVALTADISKMYRQVLVDATQTSLQRIFWRDSQDQPIKTFELLTVTYGTASASFLVIRALRKLAEDGASRYPRAAEITLRDFYVDDLVTGADSQEEAVSIKTEITALLQEGKFELRKWASNEPCFQDQHTKEEQKEFILSSNKESEKRTLGIVWNCRTDTFKYSFINHIAPLEKPTKRSILSRIALIFDPLGLLGPVTLLAKTMMQELWRSQADWDESIPLELHTRWRRFEAELQDLKNVNIPRRVIAAEQYTSLELHGFSDASEMAYAACIYLRSTAMDGTQYTRLLCSKSRVAPLKGLSLPRLELCGALLLAQLINKVSKGLTCNITSTYLWTDSTIVLSWLRSCSRSWTSFVAHRIGEIQQLTAIQQWRHVSSEDNPADPLSRGVMPGALIHLKIWWEGPPWLKRNKEEWPQSATPAIENLPEQKAKVIITVAAMEQEHDIFYRYSSLTKLIRVMAYMWRFVENSKRRRSEDSQPQEYSSSQERIIRPISVEEQRCVIARMIKLIQAKHFASEIKALNNEKAVQLNSPILRLNPFIDKNGIIRVGGRLSESSLSYEAKYPILLPGKHPFSNLIVNHEHLKHLHAGPQATLAAIREQYWIISARSTIKGILRKCVTCFRSAPKAASTIMGNLPEPRVRICTKPFEQCGVDYAGPLYYKEGARRSLKLVKCYIAIFVCLATKAVHIELASNSSSEAFLGVFRRFIARRGCPSDIFSDNGSNFVGAERELRESVELFKNQATQQQIQEQATKLGIRWHFIPPRAPHHGGIWEAAVKAAKRHLYRMVKDANLRYEELETWLIQIEAILNSRPLTPISSDPHDFASLTPGHFLIGTSLTAYPEPSLEGIPVNRLNRWQYIQQLRLHFWKRWSDEYLQQCQDRNKWQTQSASIHVGQMVIIKDDNRPPLSWPLGRIQEIHPGKDGVARVATVRTMNGTYKRPITRLCLLPIEG